MLSKPLLNPNLIRHKLNLVGFNDIITPGFYNVNNFSGAAGQILTKLKPRPKHGRGDPGQFGDYPSF